MFDFVLKDLPATTIGIIGVIVWLILRLVFGFLKSLLDLI